MTDNVRLIITADQGNLPVLLLLLLLLLLQLTRIETVIRSWLRHHGKYSNNDTSFAVLYSTRHWTPGRRRRGTTVLVGPIIAGSSFVGLAGGAIAGVGGTKREFWRGIPARDRSTIYD